MSFRGFPKDFFDFFSELAENNKRSWFEENKPRYEENVVGPCLDFISAMGPELKKISPHFTAIPKKTGGSMFRIYRDTRFSKDKTPYKTNAALHFRHALGKDAHAPGFYLHLEPGQVFYGGGMWMPPSEALKQIRASIDENQTGWKKTINNKKLKDAFGELGEGNPITRPPKGYAHDHPLIEDLKRRSFFVMKHSDQKSALRSDFLNEVTDAYRAASPLMSFLCRSTGASF
ncbi:MAG: DUF2461 domain-containing protein [Aquisalinus sp.]|nr:DUF2461 domain-containing protein [Aquisalinus sp.]